MQLGKRSFIKDSFGTAEKYLEIAKVDATAAKVLKSKQLFKQAGYFFIQAMEKLIKYHIAKKINLMNPHFADELRKTMGHSLDESVNLLIKVYTGNNEALFESVNLLIKVYTGNNEALFNQLSSQINNQVFKDINFSALHNKLRYPIYSTKFQNYSCLELNAADCETLQDMLTLLKKYLEEISRRVS